MKRREKGLTLIELMVTLAVAIVLLAIGIPAFNTLTARDISAATVNSLVTALQQARVEAISANKPVAVCALKQTNPCAATPARDCAATATNWACGWAVIRMTDNSEVRRFPQPRGEMAVSLAGAAPPEFTTRGEASGVSTFTVKAYKRAGLPRADADCVRVTDVLVSAVGQIRTEVKSCP